MNYMQPESPIDWEHPFYGRRAVLVGKHGKEQVIRPALARALHMFTELLLIDTDRFGTFTGEVVRVGTQLDALRAKLQAGLEATPYDAVIVASEGAFFPDPALPMACVNRELVGLFDAARGIEIIGTHATYDSNMTSRTVSTSDDVEQALAQIGFPDHAAVIRVGGEIRKGIRSLQEIDVALRHAAVAGVQIMIESDMRARMNPKRMAAIEAAVENAIARARSLCPSCKRPGYWIADRLSGLPCEACGTATERTQMHVFRCDGCRRREDVELHGCAPARECPSCNP